jgi:hypothetical protein
MGVRKERDVEFFRPSKSGHGVIRVRLNVERGRMTTFTVQLETYIDERWYPVVRYDSAHGYPQSDLLEWDGRVFDKFWLDPTMSAKDVVRYAERDLDMNAAAYLAAFMERKP